MGYLPEEPLAAPPSRGGVVDVDVVVLGTHRFLHEGFVEDLAVDLHVVFGFHQVTLCTQRGGVGSTCGLCTRDGRSLRWLLVLQWVPSTGPREVHFETKRFQHLDA